ncbi:unannotated protein [freshwater metagenome]|uniref:Unannotated protein n=1 Tax=freshwater metagenome TaxID=449393 RepID=A0A6J7EQR3_9ZZZZ
MLAAFTSLGVNVMRPFVMVLGLSSRKCTSTCAPTFFGPNVTSTLNVPSSDISVFLLTAAGSDEPASGALAPVIQPVSNSTNAPIMISVRTDLRRR